MSLFKEVNKEKVTLQEFRIMCRKWKARSKELQREVAEMTEWSKTFKEIADEFKDEEL